MSEKKITGFLLQDIERAATAIAVGHVADQLFACECRERGVNLADALATSPLLSLVMSDADITWIS